VTDPLDTSKAKRDQARGQFQHSLSDVRARLAPAAIKRDVIETLSEHARKRPVAAAGIIIGATIVALRKPIFGVIKRLLKEK
jgi:hypothetical protein